MDKYQSVLRKYWGYDDFRGIQRQIIESIGAGRDTLGLMPTGGGKSITFQVPAMTMDGMCIVITPLISLMKDQVESLRSRGIKATYIHSGLSHEQTLVILDNCVFNAYKFLYISPERLSSQIFLAKLQRMRVCFITVDEAHCICQWGYDFRPSYLHIATIRDVKPSCPVLALTATATPEVARDIQQVLRFREENLFRMSFARKNLAYQVFWADEKMHGALHFLNSIPGSCIIYSRNRQKCKDLAEELARQGFSATYYHAGLDPAEKDARQDAWQVGKYRIMVATNAFGMGIDKPDVRLVLHVDLPDSLEEYFQEAGRAGRDGMKSFSVIILDGKEIDLMQRRLVHHFPSIEYIRQVYEKVCFYYQLAVGDGLNMTREFNVERFCRTFNVHPAMMRSALEILEKSGYIEFTSEDETSSRLRIDSTRNELLRVLDERATKIFMSMFRNYGGIFVDYVFLDEELVASETGIEVDVIYQTLKDLSRRGLISYIPRKRMPHITFLRRRVDTEDVYPTREAYQHRKEAYEYRLQAVKEYCISTDNCRSKMLLSYFGEKGSQPCGICDVCGEDDVYRTSDEELQEVREKIVSQLSGGPVRLADIDTSGIPEKVFAYVLDDMRAHEELLLDGVCLRLGKLR